MKKSIFEYDKYKSFVHDRISLMPKKGYGQLQRIAKHLDISSVSVSHIFNGPRDLSVEQALELTEFLGLTELEADYFCLLVQLERAGTQNLKNKIKSQLQKLRESAQDLKSRIPQDRELNEEAKALFYSSWQYSAIRLLSSIDGFNSIDAIAEKLNLPRQKVREIIEFHIQHGLCVEQAGKISMGAKRTHLEATSLLVSRHHTNWRLKGIENMEQLSSDEIFYTGPMVLSKEAMQAIRQELVNLIERVVSLVVPARSEQLACLNIDWFKVEK